MSVESPVCRSMNLPFILGASTPPLPPPDHRGETRTQFADFLHPTNILHSVISNTEQSLHNVSVYVRVVRIYIV
jgi:hypothetical protein